MTDRAATLIADLNTHGSFLKYVDGRGGLPDFTGGTWITDADFANTRSGPLLRMLQQFEQNGQEKTRRAIAGSIMLRLGWASGLQIGSWLLHGRLIRSGRYAMLFSDTNLLVGVALQSGALVSGGRNAPAHLLAESLHASVAPAIEAMHSWSRFSRRALFAMLTSSWAAQFANFGPQVEGGEGSAVEEARRIFASHPLLAAAAPDIYRVTANGKEGWCQKRRLCCLYYKSAAQEFCTSCPLIPESDRLRRNREWVAQYGRPLAPA